MKKLVFFGTFLLTPLFAAAQIRDADDLGNTFLDLINNLAIPLLMAVSFLVLLWGIFSFFIAGGQDEEKRKDAVRVIAYGVIGFALMVSVWGLVQILLNTFNLQQNVPQVRPPVQRL